MFILDPKRKTLISGGVPSENLPTRKFDVVKPERRVLLRRNEDLPTRSNSPEETPSKVVKTPSLESVIKQVQNSIPSWKLDISPDNVVKLELYDDLHSLPKYTVLIHSSLEFTVAVYNWPIKEDHPIYKELKRGYQESKQKEVKSIRIPIKRQGTTCSMWACKTSSNCNK
jgi:hypothetical protein